MLSDKLPQNQRVAKKICRNFKLSTVGCISDGSTVAGYASPMDMATKNEMYIGL